MKQELVSLKQYTLRSKRRRRGLQDFNLTLYTGDRFAMRTDSLDDAHLVLRGIATLELPVKGEFCFGGKPVAFSNRKSILAYKNKVGYIAEDATLISKLSVYDNLMCPAYYFHNSIDIDVPEYIMDMCRQFGLESKINLMPWQLDPEEYRLFIIIRELSKMPQILLVERPGDYINSQRLEIFKNILKALPKETLALILLSANRSLSEALCEKEIVIHKGQVVTNNRCHCETLVVNS